MPSFYGSSGSSLPAPSLGGGAVSRGPSINLGPTVQSGSGDNEGGKTTIDMTNPVNSLFDAAGSLLGVVGGAAGGAIGAIGSIGIPGGPNIGGAVKTAAAPVGAALGALGSIPTGTTFETDASGRPIFDESTGRIKTRGTTLGEVPGDLAKALSAPQKAVKFQFARNVRAPNKADLPEDLQIALDQGASLDDIANALVARNAGYTDNPNVNLVAGLVLDPMNLAGPVMGRVSTLAKGASVGVRTAEDVSKLGLTTRFAAKAYDAATAGMARESAAVVDRLLGPATSGFARAVGTGTYRDVVGSVSRIDATAGARLDAALATANAQHLTAYIGSTMADEGKAGVLAMAGSKAEEADVIQARLLTQIKLDAKAAEDGVYRIVSERGQLWVQKSGEEMADQAVRDLAAATGLEEDALRVVVGKTATREMALLAREAVFGAAVDDLMVAKAAAMGSDVIDAGRLTLIARDTLTTDRAKEAIKAIQSGGMDEARAIVSQYSDLAAEFYGRAATREVGAGLVGKKLTKQALKDITDAAAGKAHGRFTASDVVKWLKDNMDRLPTQVKEPKSGRNPLPDALQAFRQKFAGLYDLGFEPKEGWVLREADGVHVPVRPFVSYVSDKAPVQTRNALGRVAEATMGGIRQSRIINEAQQRLIRYVVPQGLTEQEGRSVFRAILNKAKDLDTTPRGLGDQIDKVFREVLGDARVDSLPFNPTFAVNHAFEGNLGTVGLTQKITGKIKTAATNVPLVPNFPAKIAEQLYPALKFSLNPLFKLQEAIESPFWNLLRGVNPWGKIDPELRSLYDDMAKGNVARQVFEAGYATQMGAAVEVGRKFGRFTKALDGVFPGISKGLVSFKERQAFLQAAHDLGETFRDAVQSINPKFYDEMVTAYGTSDARQVAQRFLTERLNLATDQRTLGWELDKLAAKGAVATPETETMWQAFRYALTQASDQAYKTHFFNPERGWLERTVNHPYLGLYPLSYMWGKVLPEFGRFLLYKPFGVKAPLTGYEAALHVQRAIVVQMNDPEFADAIKKNDGLVYFVEMMLPGTPTNIPVNAPAWIRHAQTGQIPGQGKFTPLKEAGDVVQNIGVLRLPQTLSGVQKSVENDLKSISDMLDRAANEYDSTVPLYGLPPSR